MSASIPADKVELVDIINKSMGIAMTMHDEQNQELVELSVKSSDRIHRIAAAFYYGHRRDRSACLMNLMADQDPLVIDAARLACINIAERKHGKRVDFGPWVYGPKKNLNDESDTATIRREAIDLWNSFFEKREKDEELKAAQLKEKANKKAVTKDPREVLGVP